MAFMATASVEPSSVNTWHEMRISVLGYSEVAISVSAVSRNRRSYSLSAVSDLNN